MARIRVVFVIFFLFCVPIFSSDDDMNCSEEIYDQIYENLEDTDFEIEEKENCSDILESKNESSSNDDLIRYLAEDHKLVYLRGTIWKRLEPVYRHDKYGILKQYDQYIYFHAERDAVSYQYAEYGSDLFPVPEDDDEYVILRPMTYRFPFGIIYLDVGSGGVFFSKINDFLFEVMFFYVDAGMSLYETKIIQSFDVEKKLKYNDKIRLQYQKIMENKTNMKKYVQVLF